MSGLFCSTHILAMFYVLPNSLGKRWEINKTSYVDDQSFETSSKVKYKEMKNERMAYI